MLMATGMMANAQSVDHTNNLQLNLGGGVHSLLYSPVDGNYHIGFGGLFEAQYQLMFGHHFGIGIGAQISNLASAATYDYTYDFNYSALPDDCGISPYSAVVTTTFNNWKERQRAFDVCVPIQLLYRTAMSEKCSFQMGLGATLDHLFGGMYKSKAGSFDRIGYMERTNVTYEDLPNHGLYALDAENETVEGDLNLKPFHVGILLDLGFDINLSERTGLYLGLYGNYGPANVNNDVDQNQCLIANVYNGTFASDRVSNVNPLEAGIKIGLRFGMGKGVDAKAAAAAEAALAAEAEAARLAAEQEAEAARLAAEQKAKDEALAKAKADEAARAKALADEQARKAKEAADKAAQDARDKANQKVKDADAYIANFKDIVYFETAKADPLDMNIHNPIWDALKVFMDTNKDVKVVVAGHTDSEGRASTNQALSERRANAVKQLLIEKGIAANRIETVFKGENEPVATNDTPEGRAKNRRVEITLAK